MNKPVYLGLSRTKYNINVWVSVWLCKTKIWLKCKFVLYRYSFTVYIKNDDIYKDITEDVETRFGTSNYELDRHCLKENIKKVIGLWKMN